METMQSLLDDGSTRLIGASNWSAARIREANAYAAGHGLTPFCANQPQFSLATQMIVEDPTLVPMDAETYRLHAETGMICAPFSSQAKGFFSKLDALGAEAACRAAATTSSAGAVFGTNALAPASRAPKSWSSPAYMVSTTMPIV